MYKANRFKIIQLLGIGVILALSSQMAKAGGGVQLGLSNTYIFGGIYSFSSVDGQEFDQASEKGFVHSRLGIHHETESDAIIWDVLGEVGRYVLEDRRVGIGIGIRPLGGSVKDIDLKRGDEYYDKKLSFLELSIGVNLSFNSWIADGVILKTSAYYYLSPQVVSLGDFDGTSLKGVRVSLPIIATSELYVSYENFSGKLKENRGDKVLDILNIFNAGVRIGL